MPLVCNRSACSEVAGLPDDASAHINQRRVQASHKDVLTTRGSKGKLVHIKAQIKEMTCIQIYRKSNDKNTLESNYRSPHLQKFGYGDYAAHGTSQRDQTTALRLKVKIGLYMGSPTRKGH